MLEVHSGRHCGGRPIKPRRQVHDGIPFDERHCEFGPQGEGRHGSLGTTISEDDDGGTASTIENISLLLRSF